ncbi:MAG: hypothetical protein GYB53_02355 [Rhodobacteraceae bacterium]|nr:hypothetical protein [Paracoccaceae bacterium]MBR9820182.1 hypothetical protein [Paracoccaceae bacterium]
MDQKRQRARTLAEQQQAPERIATSLVQLNAGVTKAAAATEELAKTMPQIAGGAGEAASARRKSVTAMSRSCPPRGDGVSTPRALGAPLFRASELISESTAPDRCHVAVGGAAMGLARSIMTKEALVTPHRHQVGISKIAKPQRLRLRIE